MKKQNNITLDIVRCITCKHSYLMQRDSNPIIAECNGVRYVANTNRRCARHEYTKAVKKINPMKLLR